MSSQDEWAQKAQAFEREFWDKWWRCRDPEAESLAIMKRFGIEPHFLRGAVVLDVGCGPTRRLCCLRGEARAADAIEPLRDFYEALEGNVLQDYRYVSDEPVERLRREAIAQYDFAFAINSLDHCYNLTQALGNIWSYLKPGGGAVFSMDCDKWVETDPTHPVCISGIDFLSKIVEAGFKIAWMSTGNCPVERPDGVEDSKSWGGGLAYHVRVQK